MEKPENPPAFPREDYQADCAPGQRGMSLRDYFAAKAMQLWLSCDDDPRAMAEWSYRVADAMLKEREK